MNRCARSFAVLCLLLAGAAALAQSPSRAAFYSRAERSDTAARATPGILENWTQVIRPALEPAERRALASAGFEVPVDLPAGVPDQLLNFYATTDGRVVLPAGSVRLLRDLVTAWLWLDAKGHSTNPVSEYLAVLKYRWASGEFADQEHRPLPVLGVPENAREHPLIADKFARVFSGALFFVMAHELGHLLHAHQGIGVPGTTRDSAASIRQEAEADEFALEIMRRVGAVPDGAALFFTLSAALQAYPSDLVAGDLPLPSHPLSAERVLALAQGLDEHARGFARGLGGAQAEVRVHAIASALREEVVPALASPTVQDFWRQKGLRASLADFGPRASEPAAPSAGTGVFAGEFSGQWIDASGTAIEVRMKLEDRAGKVIGSYRFGENLARVEGVVEQGRLLYGWSWGADYFGHGVLESSDSGRTLTGTWGYTRKDSGGGTWTLRRR